MTNYTRTIFFVAQWLSCCAYGQKTEPSDISLLHAGFTAPPHTAQPGVYWYFMDGNRSKEAMREDLESMKAAGIGNLIFLEVNVGIPRGSVDLFSPEWLDMFAYAEKEAEALGIDITMGIGPGWTGSGGPWVDPGQSMQHLVYSTVEVAGGQKTKIVLPVPEPRTPYFGMGGFTPGLEKQWRGYYKDVAVLAFPTPPIPKKIEDIDEKALYYRAPYSSVQGVKAFLPSLTTYPSTSEQSIILSSSVLDLTAKLKPDGTLDWTPPAVPYTIMRFVSRNNGALTRPAPVPGLGFESDKFNAAAVEAHLEHYIGTLLRTIGEPKPGAPGGLKRLHMDSWEMGAQNWTPGFRTAFQQRRGYDPLPFYPVYAGNLIQGLTISERFLWDLRLTAQELILENHAREVKKYSHRHGLQLSIEPYDMNPTADLELGAVADVPMGEFWSVGFGYNTSFSIIEATSIAHVQGKTLVPAESFTAAEDAWRQYPGSMKNQGDWAFAAGINQLVFHTFQHQSLPDSLRPGMTMGPYGVHWDRGETWWPMVAGYHAYISRCSFLLQQGRTVADILYLTPEGAPQVFRPPLTALSGDSVLPDRKGFNFDGCSPGELFKARVEDHRIIFPSGASYRVLVLPDLETMTPLLVAKITSLVGDGAIVMGNPPQTSPGLSNYPTCDTDVQLAAKALWGDSSKAQEPNGHHYGKGMIIRVTTSQPASETTLYPDYDTTAELLKKMGAQEDFVDSAPLRYTHRSSRNWDIYFVSNRTDSPVTGTGIFRQTTGRPELWDPLSGSARPLPQFIRNRGSITVPLVFEPYQSYFIVFNRSTHNDKSTAFTSDNFPTADSLASLDGSWRVTFDPHWGGPGPVTFPQLEDWTTDTTDGIRYYSGIAQYQKRFDCPTLPAKDIAKRLWLRLGGVKDLAHIWLNGKDLGVVWTPPFEVDITQVIQSRNNVLRIDVANRWPNRLIGDQRLPDDGINDGHWPLWLTKGQPRLSKRYTFTTFDPYKKDSPLLPSGLLGPVTILAR